MIKGYDLKQWTAQCVRVVIAGLVNKQWGVGYEWAN